MCVFEIFAQPGLIVEIISSKCCENRTIINIFTSFRLFEYGTIHFTFIIYAKQDCIYLISP
jgi:hypothetical protein